MDKEVQNRILMAGLMLADFWLPALLGFVGGTFRGLFGIYRAWGKGRRIYLGYALGGMFFAMICGGFAGMAFGTLAVWISPFAGFVGMDLLDNLVKFVTKQKFSFNKSS